MKKLFYILALVTGISSAQIVNIPDPEFKAFLVASLVNANGDGEIQLSEALDTDGQTLFITGLGIDDLTGIEAFANLTAFNCSNTSVTSIDLTMLTNLASFNCSENNLLTSVDISNLQSMGYINCHHNAILASLNFEGDMNLGTLSCQYNQLTGLDVSGRANLMNLSCQHNLINSISFTNCPILDNINIEYNAIPSIDLTGLTNITFLHCNDNQIAEIIVTNPVTIDEIIGDNNQLTDLDFSKVRISYLFIINNPLVSLNLKNGYNETVGNIFVPNSSSLRFVCEDENQVAALTTALASFANVNAVINSYCSFTPGGNYNTISGRVTFDANNNGCDVNDDIQPNVRVNISDGSNTGASFTNGAGNYAFYAQTGSFTLTPNIENPSWFTFSPASAIVPFANSNNNAVNRDFCLSANGAHADVEVVIAPLGNASPGFDPVYKLVIKNKGNQTLEGNINFNYNGSVLDFLAADVIPSVNSSGILTFNYANLQPFESRSIRIFMHLNAPTDTPAVTIGDQLNFSATVSPTASDENPADNQFQYHQTVVGSFDPNDITCIEGNLVPPSEIGNYLHYIINFENTGTAAAQNIVVRDVIDVNQFDVNSLQVLDSSAGVTTKLTGNVAEFIFQNINLHSGGHGNILLKVKSRDTLTEGSSVSKRANIYFDYNFPVATNPENTTFQTLSNADIPTDATISVYPNPTKGTVNISCKNTIRSVQLYDVQGRLLQTNLVNENQATLDISGQSSGIYFVKIISDKGMAVQKIVKE